MKSNLMIGLMLLILLLSSACDFSEFFKSPDSGSNNQTEDQTPVKPELIALTANCQQVFSTTTYYRTNKDLYINNFYNSHPTSGTTGWALTAASKLAISSFLTYGNYTTTGVVIGNTDLGAVNNCKSYNNTIRAENDKLLSNSIFSPPAFTIPINYNFSNSYDYDALPSEITNETSKDYTFVGSYVEYRGTQSGYEVLAGFTYSEIFTFRTWQEKYFTAMPYYRINLIKAKKNSDSTFDNIVCNQYICLGYEIINNELNLKLIDFELAKFTGNVASFDLVSVKDQANKNSITITIN